MTGDWTVAFARFGLFGKGTSKNIRLRRDDRRLRSPRCRFNGRRFSHPTHARRYNVARRFTWPPRHPFQNDEALHVVDEVRHSDLASRANDADGAHDLGSHGVHLITKYMLDAGA